MPWSLSLVLWAQALVPGQWTPRFGSCMPKFGPWDPQSGPWVFWVQALVPGHLGLVLVCLGLVPGTVVPQSGLNHLFLINSLKLQAIHTF